MVTLVMPNANSKGTDRTAHPLLSFVICCLDIMIHIVSIPAISRPKLTYVDE